MPYKTEKKGVLLPREKDRRVHITESDKEEIKWLYKQGEAIRAIAREYPNISRRFIQYILFPERLKIVKAQFKERRKDGRYKPSKKEWAKIMKEHRAYKYKTLKNKFTR